MKKFCLLIFCLLATIDIYPQDEHTREINKKLKILSKPTPDSPGGYIFDNSYEGIQGTPFLFDSYVDLLVKVKESDSYFNLEANIDLVEDIHQNKKLIRLSNFAEPPQFAIWLEDVETGELKNVFVTHRVAAGDWEGKANVPVALPQWYKLFRGTSSKNRQVQDKKSDLVISGATPKADYFSIRVEVKPETEWICWIEMNLAGDFNDAFPEFNRELLTEDEFSNGQPALLFRADVKAVEDQEYTPAVTGQSIWDNCSVRVEKVSEGVTTARNVFDTIRVSVIKPRPKLIDKTRIQNF